MFEHIGELEEAIKQKDEEIEALQQQKDEEENEDNIDYIKEIHFNISKT